MAARSASAQTPEASPAPVRRIRSLRVGVASLDGAITPASEASLDAMWLSSLVYDAPFRWNAANAVIPGLAGEAAISGPSSIGLRLRSDAMFSSGHPVSLSHLVDAISELQTTSQAWRFQNVIDVSLSGDTAWIRLDRPDASLRATLAHPKLAVVEEGAGTGPFVLSAIESASARYKRNPYFWQIGRPHIDTLDLVEIPDDIQRSTSVATGEIDILPNVPLLDVPMLANEPTVYLVGGPGNRLCHLQVKLDIAPLHDPRVRRLLSAAVDRSRLVQVATANQAEPASTLFKPGEWTTGVEEVETMAAGDVRAALRNLGLPSDIRLHLLADNADATQANTAVVLQEQFANCGVSLSITLLEGEELQVAIATGGYDLLVSYAEPWRDPHELVWPLLSSTGELNWSGYADAQVDTLLRAAITLRDPAYRIGRYSRLEDIVQRDVPCIPLFRPHVLDAVSQRFPGYAALPPATSRGLMTLLPTDAG